MLQLREKVILSNSCISMINEIYNRRPFVELSEMKNFSIGNYFDKGNHFHEVDKRLWEWFDPMVKESPKIVYQEYRIENDYPWALSKRKAEYPSTKAYLDGGLRHVMSQGEFVEFTKKHGIYLEFTLAHIAQLAGFPNLHTYHLSTWGGNSTFLLRRKDGELVWMSFDMDEACIYGPSSNTFSFYFTEFQPNFGIPDYYIALRALPTFFMKAVK